MAALTILDLSPAPPERTGSTCLFALGIILIGFAIPGRVLLFALGGLCFYLGHWSWTKGNRRLQEEKGAHAAWLQHAHRTAQRVAEANNLETREVPVSLQRGEECYWAGSASW